MRYSLLNNFTKRSFGLAMSGRNVNPLRVQLVNSEKMTEDIDSLSDKVEKQLNVAKNALLAKMLPKLEAENADLKQEIVKLQNALGYQKPIQPPECESTTKTEGSKSADDGQTEEKVVMKVIVSEDEKVVRPSAGKLKPSGKSTSGSAADDRIDIGRLDLRVGRIIDAKKHPDADALYVETIDLGEDRPRTVVSGLVKFVPLEQMLNRLVICVCNLKPAKMRGVESQAMVLCASTPDKVEIMEVNSSCKPGDRLLCEPVFPTRPDAVLNPKKKVWETVAVDLKVSETGEAIYKNEVLKVNGIHPIRAPTLRNVPVK